MSLHDLQQEGRQHRTTIAHLALTLACPVPSRALIAAVLRASEQRFSALMFAPPTPASVLEYDMTFQNIVAFDDALFVII